MLARWLKPKEGLNDNQEVAVTIHGYGQASFGDGIRPVAIVSEIDTGVMKFVELRFLTVVRQVPGA